MATRTVPGVLGSFAHIDAACDAIRELKADGFKDLTVYSAAPNHELEEAIGDPISPVRLFTLVGGLTGCTAGFAMTIWMATITEMSCATYMTVISCEMTSVAPISTVATKKAKALLKMSCDR